MTIGNGCHHGGNPVAKTWSLLPGGAGGKPPRAVVRVVDESVVLPGVHVRRLEPHADERGVFTELFRAEWESTCAPVQWNVAQSHAGVLRGVHVHAKHHDYLVVLSGVLVLGLHDIRSDSLARGRSCTLTLDAATPQALSIPAGVCHGFYFPVPSVHVYGVTAYWDPRDELGCRFDAPELGLAWPNATPRLSARDQHAGSYRQMCHSFAAERRRLGAEAPM